MLSSCGSKYDDDTLEHGDHLPMEVEVFSFINVNPIYFFAASPSKGGAQGPIQPHPGQED